MREPLRVVGRRTFGRALWAGLLLLTCTSCVDHPVGPARDLDTYESKASVTAEDALSAVQTALLAADTAERDNTFGPYIGIVIGEAEEDVDASRESFRSIQPPNGEADELFDRLDPILDDALGHLVDLRVAARRNELAELAAVSEPLEEDAANLEALIEELGG